MQRVTATMFRTDDDRWEAVARRDRSAAGLFLYGVTTTGVYCRPACPSRRPTRSNVEFFTTPTDAERAGYRACKKCRPTDEKPSDVPEAVLRACRLIEEAEEPPSLADLARTLGISPYYFHRLFKKVIGVTPKAYADAQRLRKLQSKLRDGGSVTQALYAAGFNSSSRCYEGAAENLGMTPGEYRNGAPCRSIRYTTVECSLGYLLVAATDRGICAIQLGDAPETLRTGFTSQFPDAHLDADTPMLANWVRGVLAMIETPGHDVGLPLDIQGTAFQRRVWEALRAIPAGSTATYAEIASRIGAPAAARAVARACATNPVAVVIPCHRVVRTGGNISGYHWGVARKRELLRREKGM